MSPCRLRRPERELRNLGEDSADQVSTGQTVPTKSERDRYPDFPSIPGGLYLPEVQQVAEEAVGGVSISLLTYRHQKEAMAQEGHVGSRHVREVKGHKEHLHHSLVGVK